MPTLTNYTYDELTIDQTASYSKKLTEDTIALFAGASGDVNPLHLDDAFAATTRFKQRIGHGLWTGSLLSAAIALKLPGPGCVYLSQTLSFLAPVFIGDTITAQLNITAKNPRKKTVCIDCRATNQHGKTVAKGHAEVMPAANKLTIPKPPLPSIEIKKMNHHC